jgi:hypothetical protein
VCQEKEKKGGNDSNKNVTSNDNSRKIITHKKGVGGGEIPQI